MKQEIRFIAKDGKEFKTQIECLAHEEAVEVIRSLSGYMVGAGSQENWSVCVYRFLVELLKTHTIERRCITQGILNDY